MIWAFVCDVYLNVVVRQWFDSVLKSQILCIYIYIYKHKYQRDISLLTMSTMFTPIVNERLKLQAVIFISKEIGLFIGSWHIHWLAFEALSDLG